MFQTYEHLGLQMDDKQDWSTNMDMLLGRGQSLHSFMMRFWFYNIFKTTADVLPDWCHQGPFVCHGMLGKEHLEEGH